MVQLIENMNLEELPKEEELDSVLQKQLKKEELHNEIIERISTNVTIRDYKEAKLAASQVKEDPLNLELIKDFGEFADKQVYAFSKKLFGDGQ